MSAADRIADTILRMGQIRAEGLQRSADAQARAQAQTGQIWGGALAQLGQIPGEIAKYKLADTENKLRKQELDTRERYAQGEKDANWIYQGLMKPDENGVVNIDETTLPKLQAGMANAGVPLEIQDRAITSLKSINQSNQQFRQQQLEHQVRVAQNVMSSVTPDHPLTPGTALATLKMLQENGAATTGDVNKFMAAMNQGHDPADLFNAVIKYGTNPKAQEPIKLGKNERLISPTGQTLVPEVTEPPTPGQGQHVINGQLVGPNGERIGEPVPPQTEPSTRNPTQVDLALKAAQGDPVAAAALRLLNPEKAPGALTPDASAKRADAKMVAQGIKQFVETGEGMSPEVLLSTRATEQGMALNAELQRLGVDTSKVVREWTATKGAIRALNSVQQIRLAEVINKASASLDKLDELNQEWSKNAPRWGIKALNAGTLKAAQNGAFGPDAASVAQRLSGQIADTTAELGQGIMGGNSPTDHAFKLAAKNLSENWTQKVLDDSIKQVRYNLGLAQNARNELLEKFGVESTQVPTPPAGASLPAPAAPAGRIKVIGPQGQKGTIEAGDSLPPGWKRQ